MGFYKHESHKAGQLEMHWVGEFGRVSGVIKRLGLGNDSSTVKLYATIFEKIFDDLPSSSLRQASPEARWWYEHLFGKKEVVKLDIRLYRMLEDTRSFKKKPVVIRKFLIECGWKI